MKIQTRNSSPCAGVKGFKREAVHDMGPKEEGLGKEPR